MRLFAVGLIALGVTTPATHVHAGAHTAELGPPELKIVSQPFNVFTTVNARFVLSANLDTFVAADDRLEFLLHRRVASRDSFRSIADGDIIPAITDSVGFRMSRINRDYAGHLIAIVPINTTDKQGASLSIPFDGVYPLTIRIVDSQTGDVVTSVLTFLNRRDTKTEIPIIPFSTVASLAGPPLLAADGSSIITDNARDAVTRLINFLTTFRSAVTISIQPEIIAAFANSSEPADAELFIKLRELLRDRTVVNTTYAPCNPSLFAAMNLSSEFVSQLKFGERTLNRLLPGVTIQRHTWIAADNIDEPAMSVLKAAGITSVILLPSAQTLVKSERSLSLLGRATKTGNELISVVSPLSGVTQIKHAQPAGSERLAYKIAGELLVERDDLLSQESVPSEIKMGVVASFNDPSDSDAVVTATRALAQSGGFSMSDFGGTIVVNPITPAVAFAKNSTSFDTSRTSSIRATRREIDATQSMLGPDDVRRETWPSLFSLGTSTITATPGTYITSLRATMRATRDAVTVTTPKSVTLSSRTGAIRIQVRNDSDQDLTVRVRLTSAKLTLSNPNRIVVLTKGGTTELNVTATTRASGEIPISIWVSTPEGNQSVVDPITISANVNAIAGYGQLISVSLLLVLFAWWWSNRRSARRERLNATTV
ncbi:MAG: DUF6049 family protein [Ilumatobacteraceae bacterium]|jgi:hypothetical protein